MSEKRLVSDFSKEELERWEEMKHEKFSPIILTEEEYWYMKKQISEREHNLLQKLSEYFEQLYIRECRCFRKTDGTIFKLTKFPGECALVIEYADSYEDALLHRFEDGDRFYLEDMDEETMFGAMLQEIRQ